MQRKSRVVLAATCDAVKDKTSALLKILQCMHLYETNCYFL